MLHGKLLSAIAEAIPPLPEPQGLARLDGMGRMRLAVAWALLLLAVCALLLIVAYLCRVWRREVRKPLSPARLEEEDAWARKPLSVPDEGSDPAEDLEL